MALDENKLKPGDDVLTPDGEGKVTKIGDRFISVDLKGGKKAEFEPKDLSLPS